MSVTVIRLVSGQRKIYSLFDNGITSSNKHFDLRVDFQQNFPPSKPSTSPPGTSPLPSGNTTGGQFHLILEDSIAVSLFTNAIYILVPQPHMSQHTFLRRSEGEACAFNYLLVDLLPPLCQRCHPPSYLAHSPTHLDSPWEARCPPILWEGDPLVAATLAHQAGP